MTEEKANVRIKSGIGGWLILPMIALFIQPVKLAIELRKIFTVHYPYRIIINYKILILDVIIVLLVSYIAYFFFKKKQVTPMLFVFLYLFLFAVWGFFFISDHAVDFQPLFASIIGCLVFVPYFVFSKRVRATFTHSLDRSVVWERILLPATPLLEKWAAFLWRTRRFLYPGIIIFFIAVILISIVIIALIP